MSEASPSEQPPDDEAPEPTSQPASPSTSATGSQAPVASARRHRPTEPRRRRIRHWMEDHSGMVVLLAAACVIAGMFLVAWRRASPGTRPQLVYFYDIQTGGTYPGPVDDLPPTRAPSGGVGVRAIILSCGQCRPEDDNYTGWIERYTEGLKEVYRQFGIESEKIPRSIHEAGREIARPGIQPRWHRLRSEEGQAIRREALMRCSGQAPVACLP